jgi:hypothetical protein
MARSHCLGCILAIRLIVLPSSPLLLEVPNVAARCLYVLRDARDPSNERWNFMGENNIR